MERRLAAILAADVVGYSRLMEADEAGTLEVLKSLRRELMDPAIARHHGRLVKLMGDGALVAFASAVDAVACAAEIQDAMTERNGALSTDDRIELRIGVHLGDVIVDGDDIYGDGVNVAARLEAIADPGGICISGTAHDTVEGKLPLRFEERGACKLKNISRRIRVFGLERAAGVAVGELQPATALDSDKPSIAVLPFENMSGDPGQEFFCDGLAEDIITALSKISDLLVVARNSSFIYKGQRADVKQVSREQGVRYVLSGSFRKAGDRVRVTAELIDADSGRQIWAERYDRDLQDIFAVQDEITREIVVSLDVRLRWGEMARFWSSGTRNLEAWELVRRATELHTGGPPESQNEAQNLCRKALDLDPNYAMAWVTLGWACHHELDVGVGYGTGKANREAYSAAMDCAGKALKLDASNGDAYALLGMCHLSRGEFDEAVAMSEKAVLLSPNHADNLAVAAVIQNKSGRPGNALKLIKKAIRLCPVCPNWYLFVLGTAYRLAEEGDSAIAAFREAIARNAEILAPQVGLASILGELGRLEDARKAAVEVLNLKPDFSIRSYVSGLSYREASVLARFEDGLRRAGLPD